MTEPIRIVVVDDHPLFRGGVVRTVQECDDVAVVGEGGSADEAVRLVDEHLPDLVCLDISMPGGGIDAARRIAERHPETGIVMLTVSEEDDDVLGALKAGARGYALKGIGARELLDLIRTVAQGGAYVSPRLAARVLSTMQGGEARGADRSDPLRSLTRREEQILELVARGHSNKEVGRALDLQEKTVKHYMTSILQKLQVRNRTEAAILMRERDL